jgi:hypothetical protein
MKIEVAAIETGDRPGTRSNSTVLRPIIDAIFSMGNPKSK